MSVNAQKAMTIWNANGRNLSDDASYSNFSTHCILHLVLLKFHYFNTEIIVNVHLYAIVCERIYTCVMCICKCVLLLLCRIVLLHSFDQVPRELYVHWNTNRLKKSFATQRCMHASVYGIQKSATMHSKYNCRWKFDELLLYKNITMPNACVPSSLFILHHRILQRIESMRF